MSSRLDSAVKRYSSVNKYCLVELLGKGSGPKRLVILIRQQESEVMGEAKWRIN